VIISSSGLTSIEPFLEEVLKRSRRKNVSPVDLFELQGKIAEKMIIFEKQINIFKKTADRKLQNDEWRSREIYKAQRRMLKTVMDGLAFRLLNFERPVLRQLVEHNQTGFLTEGFLPELEKAGSIVNKTGYYVLLNNLTNFLRYGDLTIISPEGKIIDEVKTTGKARGNQKRELHELIERLNKGELKAGNQTADYIRIPGKPTTFFPQVEKIIQTSIENETGICSNRVSPYLWVSSLYVPKLKVYFRENNKMPALPKTPFSGNQTSVPTNSLWFFEQFSPNMVPYSVYPFSEKIVCEIMMGQIQLKVVLGEKEMIKSFRGKGWDLKMPSRKDFLTAFDTDDIDKIKAAIVDPKYFSTLKKGRFSYRIPRVELFQIESEFRSVKSFVDISEALIKSRIYPTTEMITTGFSQENFVWV